MRPYQTSDSADLPDEWGRPRKRPRGRPAADKGQLWGDREALVGLLSAMWGDIGWELLQAQTTADIRQALKPLTHESRHHLIGHFVRDSSSEAKAAEVRASARTVGEKVKQRTEAQTNCNAIRSAFDEAQLAISQATPEQLMTIEPILRQRRAAFEAAEMNLKSAENEEKDAEAQLSDQEDGFAQNELLEFIHSGKYAHNPLKLANAMAGIRCHTWDGMRAYAGCWQSYARCSKLECAIWPNYQFQRFEIIESIWNRRYKYPQLVPVQLFQQEIVKLPKIIESQAMPLPYPTTEKERKERLNGFIRSHLMENFSDLRLAIEATFKAKPDPNRAPFVIVSEFQRNLARPTTAADRVLAALERI